MIATLPDYADAKRELWDRLENYTKETGDPRALGKDAPWDYYPYNGGKKNQNWEVPDRAPAQNPGKPVTGA